MVPGSNPRSHKNSHLEWKVIKLACDLPHTGVKVVVPAEDVETKVCRPQVLKTQEIPLEERHSPPRLKHAAHFPRRNPSCKQHRWNKFVKKLNSNLVASLSILSMVKSQTYSTAPDLPENFHLNVKKLTFFQKN